jgi:predicted TIM-barrel fold metal-dependent hydrolase
MPADLPATADREDRAMPHADRREFLKQTAALVGAACAAGAVADEPSGDKPPIPIVDTHQHLWDLKKFRLPWVKEGDKLARSYLPSDYAAATAGLRVVQTVYMEVDVAPEQQTAEAEYVIDLCRRADNPMAAAVISGRPASEAFPRYLAQFKNSAYVKGVRQVLHGEGTPPGTCLDGKFIQGIRLLGDLGLSFDLCMRPGELPDAAKLIDACPGTRFILDHCGNARVQEKDRSEWQKDIAAVAKRKNVVGKVSGIVASANPDKWTADDLAPIVKHTLAVFGPDRVMFGGDWPVCTLAATYRQWVEALKAIVADRPPAEQRKLFHDNAVAFYGLPESGPDE